MMRGVVVAAALLVLSTPVWAQEAAPTPLDVAPAAAPAAPLPGWMEYKTPYDGEQNDIRKAHRSQEEIMAWTQDSVTNALSIPAGGMAGKMAEVQKLFTPAAWAQYKTYLSTGALGEGIRVQSHDLSTIVNGDARILNHGETAGSYRWQIDLPLVHSFNKIEADGAVRQSPGRSQRLVVVIGRQPQAAGSQSDEANVRIESFVAATAPAPTPVGAVSKP